MQITVCKLGYGGTKTEMERLLADAQKITGIKYDINNLGDVYDAIHVIQGELGLTGVAAEEAKTTFTGSLGALKASWENVLAAMTTGEGLDEAMENLSTSVGNFANNVLNMLGNLAPQIPAFVLGIFDALIANAPMLLEGGIELVAQLAVGFVDAIPLIIEKIPELCIAVLDAVLSFDWFSLGMDIVNSIMAGLEAMWDTVVSWFEGAVASLNGTAYINVKTLYSDQMSSNFGVDGSHATGLDYVPFDNYVAALHQGEMVVPASLASQLRAAGITADTQSLGSASPAQTQTVVNVVFEGSLSQLARVLAPYIKVEQERVGPSLIT